MSVLFAILSIAVGVALLLGGYRLARFIIPLWGFVAGLSLGAAIAADIGGNAFLGTFVGVTTGVLLGLLFAVLAYMYYYIAVILMVAGLGYWVGSSFMLLLGLSPGVLSVAAGITGGILVALGALAINAPKYVLIVFTALIGAVATIGGMMLLFNQIPLDIYSYKTAEIAITNSWFWSALTVVLFAAGIVAQAATSRDWEFEEWSGISHTPSSGMHQAPQH